MQIGLTTIAGVKLTLHGATAAALLGEPEGTSLRNADAERLGQKFAHLASKLADETNLIIAVSHFPPGTSKWNKIEHRLFSFISKNWRGQPLTSLEVIVSLIAGTTTRKGLKVHAEIDHRTYPSGTKVSTAAMANINLRPDEFHGNWNYEIHPAAGMVSS